jgi:hypothetical protein
MTETREGFLYGPQYHLYQGCHARFDRDFNNQGADRVELYIPSSRSRREYFVADGQAFRTGPALTLGSSPAVQFGLVRLPSFEAEAILQLHAALGQVSSANR